MGLSGKSWLKPDDGPSAKVGLLISHFKFAFRDLQIQACPGRE